MRRFAIIGIAFTVLGARVSAQQPGQRSLRLSFGFHVAVGRASRAAELCDGSEMASVRSKRHLGKVLLIGTVAATVVSPTFINGDISKEEDYLVVAALAAGTGGYLYYYSHPSDQFWQNTMSQIRVGQTRSDDVHHCLGDPPSTTSSGAEETWTYQTSHAGLFGLGGSSRSVSISMKDGVVSNVRKTDFAY